MRKLMKIEDVLERIPYSRSKLYELIAGGKFPKPVHLGGKGSFWIEQEVEEWLDSKIYAEWVAA